MRLLLAALGAAALSACAPLTAFNALSPRDPATRLAADIPYGPGPRQKLDLYAPRRAEASLPVLVFFYGGSWDTGRRQDYAFVGRAFASRGFLTVVPDYRLYPEVRYPEFVRDGALAVRWARHHAAEYGGDPTRILLAGHSAGAYNAITLALNPAFLREAGVDPASIKAVAGLAGPYDFYPYTVESAQRTFGDYPDAPATQPINHVRADAPPAFLAHGLDDGLVEVPNSVKLGQALTKAGAEAEVKLYPGLGHVGILLSLSRPLRRLAPVLGDVTAFLKEKAALSSPGHR